MIDRRDFIVRTRDAGRDLADQLIQVLEEQSEMASLGLYEPVEDEVLGGLFARVFRFLHTFILDYHLWADDFGRVVSSAPFVK